MNSGTRPASSLFICGRQPTISQVSTLVSCYATWFHWKDRPRLLSSSTILLLTFDNASSDYCRALFNIILRDWRCQYWILQQRPLPLWLLMRILRRAAQIYLRVRLHSQLLLCCSLYLGTTPID